MSFVRKKKQKGCFLCQASKQEKAVSVLWKGSYSIVVLNIFPYNNGHFMIAPIAHKGDIEKLSQDEINEMAQILKRSIKIVNKTLKPHGYNIGMNLGTCAGAGIPDHLHIHVVPRWIGDTNFMPVIASTKVIPQSIEELSKVLKKEFLKI